MSPPASYEEKELRAFLQALIAASPAELTALVLNNDDKFRATMRLACDTQEELKKTRAAYKRLYDEETRILDHNDELLKEKARFEQEVEERKHRQQTSLKSSKPNAIPSAETAPAAPRPTSISTSIPATAPAPASGPASLVASGTPGHWATHRYISLSLEELQVIRPHASRTILSHFQKTESNPNPTSRVRLNEEEFTTLAAMRPIRKGKPRFKYMGTKKATKAGANETNTGLQGSGGTENVEGAGNATKDGNSQVEVLEDVVMAGEGGALLD